MFERLQSQSQNNNVNITQQKNIAYLTCSVAPAVDLHKDEK